MSLWLVATKSPAFSYAEYGSCRPVSIPNTAPGSWVYNEDLIICPRHYKQSLSGLKQFYYDPGYDRLIAFATFRTTYWPSWDVKRLEFSAETGDILNQDDIISGVSQGIFNVSYTGAAGVGSYNKIYAVSGFWGHIDEIDAETLAVVSGGYSLDPWNWSPGKMYSKVVVNRNDDI